jgi:hypothetical protein
LDLLEITVFEKTVWVQTQLSGSCQKQKVVLLSVRDIHEPAVAAADGEDHVEQRHPIPMRDVTPVQVLMILFFEVRLANDVERRMNEGEICLEVSVCKVSAWNDRWIGRVNEGNVQIIQMIVHPRDGSSTTTRRYLLRIIDFLKHRVLRDALVLNIICEIPHPRNIRSLPKEAGGTGVLAAVQILLDHIDPI